MKIKYIYCPECFESKPDGISPQAYSRMSVGATELGGLVIECNRHGNITVIDSDNIAEEIFKFGSQPCGCDGDHEKEICH
jgi:hypothetical protein